MRRVAIIAAVFSVALILAAGSRTAHAAPLAPTSKSNDSTDRVLIVKPGDNLSKLGVEYDSTATRLFDANAEIIDPNLIYPGEHLRVPAANEHLAPREVTSTSQSSAPSSSDDPRESVSQAQPTPAPTPQPTVTTVPAAASAPKPAPTYSAPAVAVTASSVWTRLAECESSGNWAADTGNGFYGGLQFTLQSWQAVGGSGYPNEASEAEQIALAEKLQAIQGWGAWPACSAELGL